MVAALSASASAESPRTVGLAREHSMMLDGRATVQLAQGMAGLGDQPTAVLDWDATRFVLVASIEPGRGPDVRDLIAGDRELGSAKLERLTSVGHGIAYGAAPNMPRLENDRALVYVAYLPESEEAVLIFRFYVSEDGIDDARAWGSVARSIAATIKIRLVKSSHLPAVPPTIEPRRVRLPAGWTVTSGGGLQHMVSDHGTCDVRDRELDARPTAPESASHVAGRIHEVPLYWSLWSDPAGYHAETMVGAERQGQIHVQCHARRAAEVTLQRSVIEALWR
jgi:hypothetical protein